MAAFALSISALLSDMWTKFLSIQSKTNSCSAFTSMSLRAAAFVLWRRSNLLERGIATSQRTLATTVLNVKAEKEKLGSLSTPRLICTHHCIEDDKQLAHTGGESNLLLLAVFEQPFVEFPEDRIELFSSQSRYV